ncbi:hypothetical protein AFK62_10985 [Cronobacter condimenti 1330]|uniref:Uncharacterized protein n=1 Tax=Cronobacter condimenti 1330 TaxID=1073999 RepID=A0ABM5VCS3_9ENTR|nr:hypothetical protein AFK62_10985 [Cronobacter condimenti 1330]
MLAAEFSGRNPGFGLAEDMDTLFVGKSLLHRDALRLLMKTLLTSQCLHQQRAGLGGNVIEPALHDPSMLYLTRP